MVSGPPHPSISRHKLLKQKTTVYFLSKVHTYKFVYGHLHLFMSLNEYTEKPNNHNIQQERNLWSRQERQSVNSVTGCVTITNLLRRFT